MRPLDSSGKVKAYRRAHRKAKLLLLQIGRRYLLNPAAVVAFVTDFALTFAHAFHDLGNFRAGNQFAGVDTRSHSESLNMSLFALRVSQRFTARIRRQAQVALRDVNTDFGAADQLILDVAFAGEHVARRINARRSFHQQTDARIDVLIDFTALRNSRNRLRDTADRTDRHRRTHRLPGVGNRANFAVGRLSAAHDH